MSHILVTIKRENGKIEKVKNKNMVFGSSKHHQEAAIINTKKAGKGDILSFEIVRSRPSADIIAEIEKNNERTKWFVKHGFNASDAN